MNVMPAAIDPVAAFLQDNDEEHWAIAVCLHRLVEREEPRPGPEERERLVKRLLTLVQGHLEREERFLRAHHYPRLDHHLAGHDLLRDCLSDLRAAAGDRSGVLPVLDRVAAVFTERVMKDDDLMRLHYR